MRVLILGSNSCAGSHCVRHFQSIGYDILATSRGEEASQNFLAYRRGSVKYRRLDINLHLDQLEEIFRDFNPQIVINFSSQSMVAESWVFPQDWINTNISSTLKVFEIASRCKNLERFIHFSTPEVYGNCIGAVTESKNINPSTPYAVTRACGDMFGRIVARQTGLPLIITRAGNVYGEAQRLYRIIPRSIHYGTHSRQVILDGGGSTRRNFVHGEDIAKALHLIVSRAQDFDEFHISSTEYVSIRELVAMVFDQLGVNAEHLMSVGPERPGKDLDYPLDDNRLRAMGWKNEVSLVEGISRVIDWYSVNHDSFTRDDESYHHRT
jgi:dTDP-glucose 4,6-dehydratase